MRGLRGAEATVASVAATGAGPRSTANMPLVERVLLGDKLNVTGNKLT